MQLITEMEKPLFLVLRHPWFDAFADGSKRHEWRLYGKRFNESTCAIGRRVILLRGYSRRRLAGVVSSFAQQTSQGPAVAIYGEDVLCAVIGITLD